MKSTSILAAVSIAVLAVACKKDEPVTGETFTTGASAPQEQVQPQVTTGTTTTDTPEQNQRTTTTGATLQKGKDAGIASDVPPGGSDLIDKNPSTGRSMPGTAVPPKTGTTEKDPNNHSTPLGDGKSGSYTDGKGTHGGKATWGTGPHKDTKMDQPTPPAK